MRPLHLKLVLAAMVVAGALAAAAVYRPLRDSTLAVPQGVHALAPGVSLSGQLQSVDLERMKAQGFASVIDLRPDGEADDQPAANAMQSAAQAQSLKFAYVPVPHGDIPAASVEALAQALQDSPKPVLLYCRSGRRAARTWSLVEASRPGGMPVPDILAAVKASGQSADDLLPLLAQRVAHRRPVQDGSGS